MKIKILESAKEDLTEGVRFYEFQQKGVGKYFINSLMVVCGKKTMKLIDIKQFTILIIFILLGVLTVVCAGNVERYLIDGPEMMKDGTFKQSGEFWDIKNKKNDLVKMQEGILTLTSTSFKSSPGIWQRIDNIENGTKVEISAFIKIEYVIPGEKRLDQARFHFFQYDKNNKLLKTFNNIASVNGKEDWDEYDKVVRIDENAAYAKVGIELKKCKGTVRFKDISLIKVKTNPIYKYFQYPVLILWGLFLIYVFNELFKVRNHFVINMVIIATVFAIVAGTTMPGKFRLSIKNTVDNSIVDVSTKHLKGIKDKSGEFGRRIYSISAELVHFSFFGLFGFLLFANGSKRSFLMKLQFLIVFAGATEMMQFFVDERGPHFYDFSIDFIGGLVGLFICKFLGMDSKRIQ